jgi:hypothetical protein
MTATNVGAGTKVMSVTTNDVVRSVRQEGASLLVAWSLLLTPYIAAHAEEHPHESAISTHARSFGAAVKRDTKAIGAGCKEGAHRVAVAAKAVGQEVATAAKRGAAQTRAAFRGEKAGTPAS